MKIKGMILNCKIVCIVLFSILVTMIFSTNSKAFSLKLSADTSNVNKGDILTVTVTADEKFITSDFELKYDSSILEYVDETQSNLTVKDYATKGYLIAVYTDISGKGTDSVSIKFKVKAASKSLKISIQNQNFTTIAGFSFEASNITANALEITTKDSSADNNGNSNNNSNNGNSNNNSNNGNSNNNSNKNNGNSSNNNGSNNSNNNNNSSNTNNKTNTINASNSSKANGKLPYTGVKTNLLIILIIIAIIMSVVFGKKVRYFKNISMFLIIISFAIMFSNQNTVYAYSKTPKYGKYSNLIANQKNLVVSLDKTETNRELKVSEISNLIENVSFCKDSAGKKLEEINLIGTGSKIVLKDNSEYTVLLYADVNGDGKINSSDIYPIIQHILKEKTLSGVYAKAANLNNKNDLNDANINSSDIYPIIKFILGDLSTDLVTVFPVTEDVKVEDLILNITYSETNWTNKDIKVIIKSNKEIEIPTELSQYSAVLSGDKKQVSFVVSENLNKNVTIKDKDGISKTISVKVSNIDKNKPVVNGDVKVSKVQINKGDQTLFEIPLNATDNESGIEKIKYRVLKNDNVIKEEETSSSQWVKYYFTPNAGEIYKVEIYAIDNAGNYSDKKTFSTKIVNYIETEEGKQEIEQLYSQRANALKVNQEEIESINNQINNMNSSYEEKVNEINRDNETRKLNLRIEYDNSTHEINDRYNSQLNTIILERDRELHELEIRRENELASVTSSDKRAQIIANYKNMQEERQNFYNNLINDLENQRSQELSNNERQYEDMIKDSEETTKIKLSDLNNEKNAEEQKLQNNKQEKENEKNNINNDYNQKEQVLANKINIIKM